MNAKYHRIRAKYHRQTVALIKAIDNIDRLVSERTALQRQVFSLQAQLSEEREAGAFIRDVAAKRTAPLQRVNALIDGHGSDKLVPVGSIRAAIAGPDDE